VTGSARLEDEEALDGFFAPASETPGFFFERAVHAA
jgi:hypothetical protein